MAVITRQIQQKPKFYKEETRKFYIVEYISPKNTMETKQFFLPNEQSVRFEIQKIGGIVQKIKVHQPHWWNKEYYSRDYRIAFLNALSFHIEVGSSPGKALMLVIDTELNQSKRAEMQICIDILSAGGQFSDAVSLLPFIDKPLVSLLKAGESMGELRRAIDDCVTELENRKATWKNVAMAFGWIMMDIFSAVSTCFFIQLTAIPWLRNNQPATQDKVAIENYAHTLDQIYFWNGLMMWSTILFMVFLFLFISALTVGGTEIRNRIFEKLAKNTLMRNVFLDNALSANFMLLSRMLKNGVHLMPAISILENHAFLSPLKKFWRNVSNGVDSGLTVDKAFLTGGMLTEQENKILGAVNNSQQLAKIMDSFANNRRSHAELGTNRFIRIAVAIGIIYMVASSGMLIWAVMAQDTGLNAGFGDLMKGGF